ncbi:MAG: hypothetical protein ACOC45_02795 [Alkalispirochaetaceae bacterium]
MKKSTVLFTISFALLLLAIILSIRYTRMVSLDPSGMEGYYLTGLATRVVAPLPG